MRNKPQFCLTLASILLSGQAFSQVYRCVGEDGEALFQSVRCSSAQHSVAQTLNLSVVSAKQSVTGLRASEKRWLKQRELLSKKPLKKRRQVVRVVDNKKHEKTCWKKTQQLDVVKAKLRRGYKPSQGEHLRRKRRSHEDYLSRFCG